MYKLERRIETLLKVLKNKILYNVKKVTDVFYLDLDCNDIAHVLKEDNQWSVMTHHPTWGGKHRSTWFKIHVHLPEDDGIGEPVLEVCMRDNGRWENYRPQFMVYINGIPIQGLDVNHRMIFLKHYGRPGDEIEIYLNGYAGEEDLYWWLECQLGLFHRQTEQLYFNIKAAYDVSIELEDTDPEKHNLMNVLNDVVNLLNLSIPYSKEYYESVTKANELCKTLYGGRKKDNPSPKVFCIGHTHIDVAWLWTVDETRKKAGRSFSTVLRLMDEYPQYHFFSSQPILYKFVKEDYPEIYEQIQQRVVEKKWEPEGSMYVEADCNLISGESLVRQILYGKQFFKSEFGVDTHILWLPDVFGYNGNLPQILRRSGLDFFITSKISWNQYNKMPHDLFYWTGIDGTTIPTAFITTPDAAFPKESFFTTYNGMINAKSVMGTWERFQDKDISDGVILPYGYGDGGGGTTREMIEYASRLEKGIGSCPKVIFSSLEQYVQYSKEKLEQAIRPGYWRGELYLEFHRGTYTSNGTSKRNNRKAEYLLHNLEYLYTCHMVISQRKYPEKEIRCLYEEMLLQQFHDILPGSSIEEVYKDSEKAFALLFEKGKALYESGIESLMKEEEEHITIWNMTGMEQSADVKCPYSNESIWVESVPAYGYKVIPVSEIKKASINSQKTLCIHHAFHFETIFYDFVLDHNGNIERLYDKKQNRDILCPGNVANRLVAYEDFPYEYDNWELSPYYTQKSYYLDQVDSIQMIENNGVRAVLRIRRSFLNSTIDQDMIVYHQSRRIDFVTKVDWHEKHLFLKAEFPVEINSEYASYDIAFGNVKRVTHSNTSWDFAKYEVCAHKWADLSETNYGVSILNDCKYGYDIHDSVMKISLIKAGTYPNPNSDQGLHKFTYALLPHSGDFTNALIEKEAEVLNNPLVAIKGIPIIGLQQWSFVSCMNPNIKIVTIKKSESDDGIIVRLHEVHNTRGRAELILAFPMQRVVECNLIEEEEREVSFRNNRILFQFHPYEIKTFKFWRQL